MIHKRVTEVVYAAIDEINRQRPVSDQLIKSENTLLTGSDAALDSLGLITFILSVEQKIQEHFHQPISLSDENIIQSNNGPLMSIGSLITYIAGEIGVKSG